MSQKSKQSTHQKERFEVLLEDMHSDVKIVAEQSTEHTKQLGKIEKILENHGERLDTIEITLEFIKNELKQKVDRDEFRVLEKRLSILENKVRTNF